MFDLLLELNVTGPANFSTKIMANGSSTSRSRSRSKEKLSKCLTRRFQTRINRSKKLEMFLEGDDVFFKSGSSVWVSLTVCVKRSTAYLLDETIQLNVKRTYCKDLRHRNGKDLNY